MGRLKARVTSAPSLEQAETLSPGNPTSLGSEGLEEPRGSCHCAEEGSGSGGPSFRAYVFKVGQVLLQWVSTANG